MKNLNYVQRLHHLLQLDIFPMSSTESSPAHTPTANGSSTPTQRTTIPYRPIPRVFSPPRPRTFQEYWSTNDSHLVALFSFLTGVVLAGSLAGALYNSGTPQCWLYVSFLAIFHFLEYFITAKYKPYEVTLDGKSRQ